MLGITTRQTKDQISAWVKDHQQHGISGDAYAKKLYKEYNQYGKMSIPRFLFSPTEFEQLYAYLKANDLQVKQK